MQFKLFMIVALTSLLPGCYYSSDSSSSIKQETSMKLSSESFTNDALMPKQYTRYGQNISPQLSIADIPKGTNSLALIIDDPDAPKGTFTHLVLFNIEPSRTTFKEGDLSKPDAGTFGTNSFGTQTYEGPQPPDPKPHHYIFKLYALDTKLPLASGASKADVIKEMEGHIVGETKLTGLFGKP
jgi:Raf kinase inhibitor-like YbhB/YbcL family protein